jgi:HrpA-like RNA helicase
MMIGITQPRRVAAITVANRVAEEMGTEVKAVSSWNDFLFLQIPWK